VRSMGRTLVRVLTIGLVTVAPIIAQTSLADRIVGPMKYGPPALAMSSGLTVQEAIQVAHAAGVAVGFESSASEPPRALSVRGTDNTLVAGHTLRSVLDAMIANTRSTGGLFWSWKESEGVVHVSLYAGARTFLDAPVASFEVSNMATRDAFIEILRAIEPSYPRRNPNVRSGVGPVSTDPVKRQKNEEILERPVSIRRRAVDVRALLDALVVANGELSWSVRYDTDPTKPGNAVVWLHTAFGQGEGLRPGGPH